VRALGALRGEIAWVLRAVTPRGSELTTAEIWAIPIAGGDPKLAASYVVGPFSVIGPVSGIRLDRQLTRLGTRVVLERPNYRELRTGLVVVDVTDGSARLVGGSDDPARFVTPAWSPDMTRLAFVVVGDISGGTVLTMGPDGGGQRLVVGPDLPRATVLYGWTDDAHLAFGRQLEGASYEVVAELGGATWALPGEGWRPPAPADWRRNVPRFVGATSEGGEQRVVVADDVGAPPRVITREAAHPDPRGDIPASFSDARWNPRTGEVMYQRSFSPDTSGPFEKDCFVVSTTGGTPARLPLAGKPLRCEWLPSGDRVAYLQADTGVGGYATALRVAMRDGSGEREYALPPVDAGDVRLLDVAIRVYP
jgi:hypothetical protein